MKHELEVYPILWGNYISGYETRGHHTVEKFADEVLKVRPDADRGHILENTICTWGRFSHEYLEEVLVNRREWWRLQGVPPTTSILFRDFEIKPVQEVEKHYLGGKE